MTKGASDLDKQHQRKIPVTTPVFDESDFASIIEPLKSGWVVQGPKVKEFETLFQRFSTAKHSIAVTSCTTALHLGLVAAGVKPGDEVITPSFTFVATANAVEYVGATPVFVDIDPATYNIDARKMAETVESCKGRVKAIIPVHLFGLCADMDSVMELAGRHGLAVVEDAACAFGSFYKGRHAGVFGDTGCFSFHPRKAITTGEGGMITTNDDKTAELLRSLRDHGASKSDLQRHMEKGGSLLPEYNMLGYNYRMTDIQGALGASQMAKADGIIRDRRAAAKRYDAILDFDWLVKPVEPEGFVHSYQSYVCHVDKSRFGGDTGRANIFRNRMMSEMEAVGISVRQGTHAVHTLGYYKNKYGLKDSDFPRSYEADRLTITLPLYAGMKPEDQDFVVETMAALYRKLANN